MIVLSWFDDCVLDNQRRSCSCLAVGKVDESGFVNFKFEIMIS